MSGKKVVTYRATFQNASNLCQEASDKKKALTSALVRNMKSLMIEKKVNKCR